MDQEYKTFPKQIEWFCRRRYCLLEVEYIGKACMFIYISLKEISITEKIVNLHVFSLIIV